MYAVTIAYDGDGDNYTGLSLNTAASAADHVRAVSKDVGAGFQFAASTADWTVNAWHHIAGVWTATNSRAAFLNGGNKGTDIVDVTPVNLNVTSIGRVGDSTPVDYMDGRIAEVGIWDVALTDAEIAILAAGFSPLFIRPQNLVAYWPLIRDEDQDRVGGYGFTAYNTPTIGVHPPVIMPSAIHLAYLTGRRIYITHA
jgi:hypothetical protein